MADSEKPIGEEEQIFGCEHYKRKCQFLTPCCKKMYVCRFCHDDNEKHALNRKDVTQIQCLKCQTVQDVQQKCCNCDTVFGNYFCPICNLFDDEDKSQYHCDGCGICRVGGRDKFFHCGKCDMCLPIRVRNNHKCIEKVSRSNCPICLEDLHTSRMPSHFSSCGHFIHRNCFEDLLKSGNYTCPICSESMVNMSKVWSYMDTEILNTPMPEEYANKKVWILCRDCHKECRISFHVLGLKCQSCGGYNTCRTKNPNGEESEEESETTNEIEISNETEENDDDELSPD